MPAAAAHAALWAVLLLLPCALAAPAHPWNPTKLNLAPPTSNRDGYLYVPPTYTKSKPSPLLVLFHPAGKDAKAALELIEKQQPLLDRTRTIVLLPESRGPTWDLTMSGQFGPDIVYLRSALPGVLKRYNIDRSRVALAGFSDGTVALSLLPLGGIASHIIAWSPGGFAPPLINGQPKVAMFHGTSDTLFPIDKTSQPIVPFKHSTRLDALLPAPTQPLNTSLSPMRPSAGSLTHPKSTSTRL